MAIHNPFIMVRPGLMREIELSSGMLSADKSGVAGNPTPMNNAKSAMSDAEHSKIMKSAELL